MDLDLETLLIARVLPMTLVTAVFATTAAMRHNDEANRAWTAAFAAALCVTALDAIYAADGSAPLVVVAAGDASTVFSVGAMWAGCRLLDNRERSNIWMPLVAAIAVAVPTLVQTSSPDLDLSTTLRTAATGVFAWLAATELLRGPMRLNLNARILQGVFLLFGAWYITLAALNAGGAVRPDVETTALPFTALFVVSAICLSALRVERAGNWWSMSAEARRRSTLNVLAADAFREDAADRLERATRAGSHVALVLAEIDDLDELNSAFGREAGDNALVHFSGILRSRVPADALLGHLGAGRFVVLVVAASTETPRRVVDAIRTGLTESSVGEGMELRTGATFGTGHTIDSPATFDSLLGRADADLAKARQN
jgi:diguanylate cyclase (GGDEF)-like protein